MMIMLRRKTLISSTVLSLPYSSSSSSSKCKKKSYSLLKPPTPKKIPSSFCAHGRTWVDPYRWMSNTDDPNLVDHLHNEKSYAEAFMADTQTLRRRLVAEMKARMPAKIVTSPESWGDWLYYQFIPDILCRRLKSQRSFAAVLNALKGSGYVHVGICQISPDLKYLAYTLDRNGSEMFVLQVKDLQTGRVISNSRVEGVVSLAWAEDSGCLLYTVCDESLRPYRQFFMRFKQHLLHGIKFHLRIVSYSHMLSFGRVFCTNLASNVADDLLFTENDINCCVDITNTKDGT